MKRFFSLVISVFLILSLFCGCEKGTLKIFDGDGKAFAEIEYESEQKNEEYVSYTQIVLEEAIEIIKNVKSLSKRNAEKELYKGNYSVYTYLDPYVYDNVKKSYTEAYRNVDFGCAVTNLKGDILAVCSFDTKDRGLNFSTEKTQPFSAFKPIAVYAPAIEKGVINYSSMFNDSPYKKVKDTNGYERDWPTNANGKYSNSDVLIYNAIKKSLNTVAVKCLAEFGVNNSLDFLRESFGLELEESAKASILGEDEVIGNIAMGYLLDGVSPVDMAGYYQIFGNSGVYNTPKTISKICDSEGKEIYSRKREDKQVISAETAQIMNSLLSGVISGGGTGEKVNVSGVPVIGKTGTGSKNTGNWFVGVTPDYSCAVWHSNYSNQNFATDYFSTIIGGLKKENTEFKFSGRVIKKIYCTESGKILGAKCKKAELGLYTEGNLPDVCNMH